MKKIMYFKNKNKNKNKNKKIKNLFNIDKNYSNTIELYDSLPKYIWHKKRKFKNLNQSILKRNFKISGINFIIKIKPAIIETKFFKKLLIYPGQREEIIEDVLRKLAIKNKKNFINKKYDVKFSLYELYKELKKIGHEYNLNEIKESIKICRGTILEFIDKNNNIYLSSNLFSDIRLLRKYKSKKNKCYVQFNPLVNKLIMNLSFKSYSYKTCMNIHSPLARYIYKRISYFWNKNNNYTPYKLNLINFLKFSSRNLSNNMSGNIRAMKNALNILLKKKIIINYFFKKKKKKYKISNIEYNIYPNKKFIKKII